MSTQRIPFGSTVTDCITGFRGIATGMTSYITGCTQYLVQPTVKPDGDFVESRWIDDDRLCIDKKTSIISLPTRKSDGPDKPAPRR